MLICMVSAVVSVSMLPNEVESFYNENWEFCLNGPVLWCFVITSKSQKITLESTKI